MERDAKLSRISGEFRDRELEAAFQAERLAESIRQARLVMAVGVAVNLLFLLSDLRHLGTPLLAPLLAGRAVLLLACAATWRGLRPDLAFRQLERRLLLWAWAVVMACALMFYGAPTALALTVSYIVTGILLLGLPIGFWPVLATGGLGGAIFLAAQFLALPQPPDDAVGRVTAMAMLIAAAATVLTTANRMRRIHHLALHSERGAATARRRSEEMVTRIFSAVPVPLTMTRLDGTIIAANQAALDFFGFDADHVARTPAGSFYVDRDERDQFIDALRADGYVRGFETRLKAANGRSRHVLLSASLVEHDGAACLVTGMTDIDERKRLEDEARRLATTDPLTGLANRRHFFAVAEAERVRAQRYSHPLTLLMIDIDHFKRINDGYGHEAGDAALFAFAELCRETLREHDLVARMGGEEFAILLPETDLDHGLAVAERLNDRAPVLVECREGRNIGFTLSVGACRIEPAGETIEAALRRADRALYEAKRNGRNRIEIAAPAPVAASSGAKN